MSPSLPDVALLDEEGNVWAQASSRIAASPRVVAAREPADQVFGLVYRQMRSLAGARPDFDDLVQIAAEQALRSLESFEGRCKISTWTYRICYLTLLKQARWYRRWLRRFAPTAPGDLPEWGSGPTHDSMLEAGESRLRLRQAVARLSPKRRAIVVMHDLEGLDVDEIARVVRIKAGTVRSRLRDGRRRLAEILADDPYFGDRACAAREVT